MAAAKATFLPTGVSSGRLNRAMFPLVLPTPLSKKWGAKLAWARKRMKTDTSRELHTSKVTYLGPANETERFCLPAEFLPGVLGEGMLGLGSSVSGTHFT